MNKYPTAIVFPSALEDYLTENVTGSNQVRLLLFISPKVCMLSGSARSILPLSLAPCGTPGLFPGPPPQLTAVCESVCLRPTLCLNPMRCRIARRCFIRFVRHAPCLASLKCRNIAFDCMLLGLETHHICKGEVFTYAHASLQALHCIARTVRITVCT
jgi:hypothetical protein